MRSEGSDVLGIERDEGENYEQSSSSIYSSVVDNTATNLKGVPFRQFLVNLMSMNVSVRGVLRTAGCLLDLSLGRSKHVRRIKHQEGMRTDFVKIGLLDQMMYRPKNEKS